MNLFDAIKSIFPVKQWQIRQEDGSWVNVSNTKARGYYRKVTVRRGVPRFSDYKEVKHGS